MNFREKLDKIVHKNNSLLSIGLDIDKEKMPNFLFKKNNNPYIVFNKAIINETKDLVCAYKINLAYYEVLGRQGMEILEKTIDLIPNNIIVILDGKRNDIGNTAKKYAKSLFETYKADSVTINPYLGYDGIKPFLEYKDRCSFILCKTSNPSSVEFQDIKLKNKLLYEYVAEKIKQWNIYKNCGAVVGATYPMDLKKIREILGEDVPILIPGVGKQGGDLQKTVKNGTNQIGKLAIINSSRGIIYSGKNIDYFESIRQNAEKLRDEINSFR